MNEIHYYSIYDAKFTREHAKEFGYSQLCYPGRACEALKHVWYCTNLENSSPRSGKFHFPLSLVCRILFGKQYFRYEKALLFIGKIFKTIIQSTNLSKKYLIYSVLKHVSLTATKNYNILHQILQNIESFVQNSFSSLLYSVVVQNQGFDLYSALKKKKTSRLLGVFCESEV